MPIKIVILNILQLLEKYLLLELIELLELVPVIEGFLVMPDICSLFLPGLTRIENGLKSVTQFGIKSLNKKNQITIINKKLLPLIACEYYLTEWLISKV